jgi:hypothetical protein
MVKRLHERIGRQKAADLWVIDPAIHVNEPVPIKVLVPCEAAARLHIGVYAQVTSRTDEWRAGRESFPRHRPPLTPSVISQARNRVGRASRSDSRNSDALLALGVLVLGAWYAIDGQPLPQAEGFLRGEGYAAAVEADGALLFTPAEPNGRGLLVMHGALIKPLAYAKTAVYFAARGYLVYVPSGPARLSINAVDAAAARMATLGVRDWVMIGHSMGGFAGLKLLSRLAPPVKAVALWACAMPADFSALAVPMLFLHGDRDGLLPPERLAAARAGTWMSRITFGSFWGIRGQSTHFPLSDVDIPATPGEMS